jgi:predicted ATPase/DNA-binding XRE family transcriptional regulator/Flp pilus assembly protein TadD
METFGEWLRRQRTARKLTREEFAKRVGCSVSALQKIEYGERRPSTQIAELMANCLEVPPEERLIFVRVARRELSVDRLYPGWKSVATPIIPSRKFNLPISPTPLIGREHELEQLSQLLGEPHCRLLTLVGPGGIGKTRLAIEAASSMQDDFDHGVYFVPLASVSSTSAVVSSIANAIHFAFYGPSDTKVQLLNYLREKQLLLVVDNVEHLLVEEPEQETIAELLVEILRQAEHVKLLITSRECLELQEEWVFDVEGLPVPDSIVAEGGAQNTAMELFLQRARRAHVGYNFTVHDYPTILHICQLVDGMPLGIELAAAWVRTLSCDAIARQIEHGLDFLSVTTRDLPARHRSMRAVFDHSWKLLPEEEKLVLAQLSVFRGGFRHEAAEQIAGATLSLLSALVTKSLVRRSGENRYDLHELVRQFAAENFSKNLDEQITTQNSHSKYYLTSFGRANARMHSLAQREALAEWTAEMDNIRVAWDWAITQSEFGLIEESLRAFAMLYETRGLYREGLDMLNHAINRLEVVHGASPTDLTGKAALGHLLTNCGLITLRLGRHAEAQAILERSLEILRPLNDTRLLVEPITFLGVVMSLTGDYAKALDLVAEAREKALAVDDQVFAATSLSLHANFSRLTGQPGDQHARLQAAVAEWRAVGDPRFIAYGLNFLGQSALALGRFDEARKALEESVELNTSVGARWNLGHAYQGLGAVAQAEGDYRRAVDLFLQAVDIFTELGGLFYIGQCLAQMGQSLFALENEVEAEHVWREALRIATEIHGVPVMLEAIVGMASLRAKRGEMQPASELLLIVLDHPACDQETRNRAENLRADLATQLSLIQMDAIQAHAKHKHLEAVVQDLLK